MTDALLLDRIEADGAFVVFREDIKAGGEAAWIRHLHRSARARRVPLSVRVLGSVVILSDPAFSQRIGAVHNVLRALPTMTESIGAVPDASKDHPSRGAQLRLIRGGRAARPVERPA